ncbi:hypothetical protein [Paludibacter sp. 221]|uniref:hypothetical protein n=1 Tax=Paludibacter sp. 221 TaxID=2302939 RepID=UPI0013D6BD47|nr:hypothetical protein [Paludibacter sp. 221]
MKYKFYLFLLFAFHLGTISAQWSMRPYLEYKSSAIHDNIGAACIAGYAFEDIYSVHAGGKIQSAGLGSFFAQGDFMWTVSEEKRIDAGFYNKYIYCNYFLYDIQEFTVAVAGVLKTRYVDVTLGFSNRLYWNVRYDEKAIYERANFLYEIKGRVFEEEHKYNLIFSISNIDDFYIERVQFLHLKAGGRYKLNGNVSLFLDAGFIPAGFFHLVSNYYAGFFKSGVELSF